ncbi:MAG: type II toxin-antitoxin system HicB family antitoxin [Candidatus Marinimicrobia bacterium]|nr:type II toxin-antitoxin system HicB family antitoxin [Candidatus Neomarinimicrobiota bacterium]MCH8068721.1 type II toxin-antitoxin system HicB family antitoxin [Candidatus Neomarinimicrobiota bacterium]
MSKYEIIIYWDKEDEIYIAEVPELQGCLAHGNSYDEALVNVKDAIQLWLDTAREFGDPIPEAKGHRLVYA